MKKLMGFIIGLLTMLVMFAMVCVSGIMYDTGRKAYIEPFFMRMGFNAADMPESPRPLSEVNETRLRDWLIQTFVYEYFYIDPGSENIARRTEAGTRYAPLAVMSSPDVFKRWTETEAKNIEDLAARGVRRTVRVFDQILKPMDSGYYTVDYETKTWYKPNDMTEVPVVERGTIYLSVESYSGELRVPTEYVIELLHSGLNPAMAFGFRVNGVITDK